MRRFEMTPDIQMRQARVVSLRNAMPSIMRPARWYERSFSMRDRVEFMDALSDARTNLFLEVARTYPILRGKTYAVDENGISCETLEEPQSADAVDPVSPEKAERSTRV